MTRILVALFVLLCAPLAAHADSFDASQLISAAVAQSAYTKSYDGAYTVIPYPGGDVPKETGVCTDVVIRAYRTLGFDLQRLVHEDMKRNFSAYPKIWGLSRTDTNIDHRRVPNLQVFFARHGRKLAVSDNPADYKPGDIVTWDLTYPKRPLPHIGIVTDQRSDDGVHPLIVHNIGRGVQVEDMLFSYKITGHYRYAPQG
ncbi:MAG: DUF1287 domain-containing protein [Alphaproteobacteria bacterium]|nr:MAG: DUF1287 domain-containing protein [Alphaproteobacteria bacterium]